MNYKWENEIKECYYKSPGEFLWTYVMGGCGCGSSEYFEEIAWEVFELFATKSDNRWKKIYGENDEEEKTALVYEAIAQWLDSKDLLEHGTSIAGSWLNEQGEALYEALKEKPNKI
jgi:hypothetical protein